MKKLLKLLVASERRAKATSRAKDLAPIIKSEMLAGQSLRAIAQTLDAKGITTPRGSAWTAASVQRVIRRFEIN